jgi:hypothetical protein
MGKILEHAISLIFTAHPMPSSELEFHPIIADTDTRIRRSGRGDVRDELEEPPGISLGIGERSTPASQ